MLESGLMIKGEKNLKRKSWNQLLLLGKKKGFCSQMTLGLIELYRLNCNSSLSPFDLLPWIVFYSSEGFFFIFWKVSFSLRTLKSSFSKLRGYQNFGEENFSWYLKDYWGGKDSFLSQSL